MNITTKSGTKYKVYQWHQEQWLRHFEFIATTGVSLLHRLELEGEGFVYVVSEEFFLQGIGVTADEEENDYSRIIHKRNNKHAKR